MVNSTSSPPNQSQRKQKAEEAAFRALLKQLFYDITNDILGSDFSTGLRQGREATKAVAKALLEKAGSDRIEITLKGKKKPLLTIYENGEFESSLGPDNSYILSRAISRALEGDTRALEGIGAIDVNKVTANGQREKLLSIDQEGKINLSPEVQVNFQGGRDSMFNSNFYGNVPPVTGLGGIVDEMAVYQELQNLLQASGMNPEYANYMMRRSNPEPREGILSGETVFPDIRYAFGNNPDSLRQAAQPMAKPNKKNIKKLFHDAGVIEAGDSITLGDDDSYTLSINDDEGVIQYLIEQNDRHPDDTMIYSAILNEENNTLEEAWNQLYKDEINFLRAEVANLKESQEYDSDEWDFSKSDYDSPRKVSKEYLVEALKEALNNPKVDLPEELPEGEKKTFLEREQKKIKEQLSTSQGYKVEDKQGRYSFTVRETAKSTPKNKVYQVIDNFEKRSATFEAKIIEKNGKQQEKLKLETSNLSPKSEQLFLESQKVGPSIELPLSNLVGKMVNHLKLRDGESERIGSYGIRRIDKFEDGPIYYLEKENDKGKMEILRAYLKEGAKFVEAGSVYDWDKSIGERPSTEKLGREIINDLGNAFENSSRKLRSRQRESSRRNYTQEPKRASLSIDQVLGSSSVVNLSSPSASSKSDISFPSENLGEKLMIDNARANAKMNFESRATQKLIENLASGMDLKEAKKQVFKEDVEAEFKAAAADPSKKVSRDEIKKELQELYGYDPEEKSKRSIPSMSSSPEQHGE